MRRTQRLVAASLWIAMLVSMPFPSYGHGDSKMHATDFVEVFDGYNDGGLFNIYRDFSSGVDSKIPREIRAALEARFPDRKITLKKHRYFAHAWPYGTAIPRQMLLALDKDYPGAWNDISIVWQRFCGGWNKRIAAEFGLQPAPHLAKAWCAMLYHTHLLGDWQPETNKDFDYVMPVEDIVKNLCANCHAMFDRTSQEMYAKQFESALKFAYSKAPGDETAKAKAVMKELKAQKLGTKLHETFAPKVLNESRHKWSGGQAAVKTAA